MKTFIILGLIGSIYGGLFGGGLLGGWHDCKDVPDDVEAFAKTFLQTKYHSNSQTTLTVDETTALEQVVAGMNYKFKVVASHNHGTEECMFNVYKDLQGHITTNEDVKCTKVSRQLGVLAGGVSTVSTDDKGLQGAIMAVSKHINMMSNSMMHMTVVNVAKPTKQVIRGMKYTFDVDFQEADTCRNDQMHFTSTFVECPPKTDGMKEKL